MEPGGESILVVDDKAAVLQVVVQVLRHAGFDVLSALSGQSAMLLAEPWNAPIHLLISDIEMPGMLGPDLGRALTSVRPDMRVILMSGGSADGNLLATNHGWAYLQKPFTGTELLDVVRSALYGRDRPQWRGKEFCIRKNTGWI